MCLCSCVCSCACIYTHARDPEVAVRHLPQSQDPEVAVRHLPQTRDPEVAVGHLPQSPSAVLFEAGSFTLDLLRSASLAVWGWISFLGCCDKDSHLGTWGPGDHRQSFGVICPCYTLVHSRCGLCSFLDYKVSLVLALSSCDLGLVDTPPSLWSVLQRHGHQGPSSVQPFLASLIPFQGSCVEARLWSEELKQAHGSTQCRE